MRIDAPIEPVTHHMPRCGNGGDTAGGAGLAGSDLDAQPSERIHDLEAVLVGLVAGWGALTLTDARVAEEPH